MDVHPPEHGIHSWRDFWVHLGTITLGLLIAIGLEQSVVKLHERHERHQLETELREEGQRNIDIVKMDLANYDSREAWLLKLREDADVMRASGGKTRLPFRQLPRSSFYVPVSAVWQTAKEGSLTTLLPAQEAQMYTVLYRELDFWRETAEPVSDTSMELRDVEANFAPAAKPFAPDFTHMSDQQLEAYAGLLNRYYIGLDSERTRLVIFDAVNRAVLHGATSETQFLDAMIASEKLHPSLIPNPSSGTAPDVRAAKK